MKIERRRGTTPMAAGLRFVCLLLILSALVACGKKGPLYLPPDKLPTVQTVPESMPVAITAPDAEAAKKPAAEDTDKTQPTDVPQP